METVGADLVDLDDLVVGVEAKNEEILLIVGLVVPEQSLRGELGVEIASGEDKVAFSPAGVRSGTRRRIWSLTWMTIVSVPSTTFTG